MDELTKKRRLRGGQRSSSKKLVAKVVEAIPKISKESPQKDVVWLKQSQSTLKEKIKTLKELDEKILDALSESKEENADELMAKEIEETDEVIAEIERVLIKTDDALSKIEEQSVHSAPTHLAEINDALNNSQVSSDSTGKIVRAKLPKLRLKNFSGKFCEWPEFWDSFSSSIDNNDQLSDVDKFAYLRGYLEGQAKSTIAGLSLTATNYQCAIDLLKKRFEKKSAIQRTHVNDLIHLPAVFRERDTQRLRKLYDSCEAHNRALKSLGVNEESINPKGLRREFLGINTFGQKCTKAEQREVVELEIKPVNGNNVITIEAYVVPEICTVQNSHVELARKHYSHLEGIWFSDVVKSQEELEVDVLIGADYLWRFQSGDTR